MYASSPKCTPSDASLASIKNALQNRQPYGQGNRILLMTFRFYRRPGRALNPSALRTC